MRQSSKSRIEIITPNRPRGARLFASQLFAMGHDKHAWSGQFYILYCILYITYLFLYICTK